MRKVNGIELDEFTEAYIICALWSSSDMSDDPEGPQYETLDEFSLEDIDVDTLLKMKADCEKFQAENAEDIAQIPDVYCSGDSHGRSHYSGLEAAGHDFWYTRNGHGVGFWDRDFECVDALDRLDKACKKWGEFYLYVGDDGKIHGN